MKIFKNKLILILTICMIVCIAGVIAFMLISGTENVSRTIEDDSIALRHSSGESIKIPFRNIASVKKTEALDIGTYVSGIKTDKYSFGIWNNEEFGDYKICTQNNVTHYVLIVCRDYVLVYNTESNEATDRFYESFVKTLYQ